MRVLEAEDDPGLAVLLGLFDVGRVAHQGQQVAVLADGLLHLGDVVHRALEIVPHGDGAVGGGQAALFHVLEDRTVPLRDDETVDDDGVLVQVAHGLRVVRVYANKTWFCVRRCCRVRSLLWRGPWRACARQTRTCSETTWRPTGTDRRFSAAFFCRGAGRC